MITHLVAVITLFQSLGSNRCQSSDIYMEFQKNCWFRWRNCRNSWKSFVLIFWKRWVTMFMIAHVVAIIRFFQSLGSNRCQSSDICMKFSKNCWIRWRKCWNSWETFNNFRKWRVKMCKEAFLIVITIKF